MKRLAWLFLLLPVAAHATVTSQTFSVSYTCTGSTGPFPFVFPISDPTAMTVSQNGVLLSPTAYSIVPVNNNYDNGGSITLVTPCTSGVLQLLKRQTPLTQLTVFADNMPLPMKSIENGLDKLTEIDQEQESSISGLTNTVNGAVCGAGSALQSVPGPVCIPVPSSGGTTPAFSSFPPGLISFGDSICVGTGATASSFAFITLLSNQLGALQNYCVSGYLIQSEPGEMYANTGVPTQAGAPTQVTEAGNPLSLEEGGKNDATLCAGSAPCIANSQLSLNTVLTHRGSANIVPVSSCATTGTWGTDTLNATAKASSTIGSTITCTVTTYGANGAIGVPARAWFGNGGTATVTIDGAVQATTLAPNAFLSAVLQTGYYVFTTMYPVAGGTHTVVVTVTSATSGSNVISIPDMVGNPNPLGYYGAPTVGSMEVIPYENQSLYQNSWTAAINTMKLATVTQLAGYGFNVRWLPIVNVPCTNGVGNCTGGFVVPNYVSNQPTDFDPDGLQCNGSTSDTIHPNNCGHKQMFQAVQTDLGILQSYAGSAALNLNIAIPLTSYTISKTDGIIYMDCASPCTLTLPDNLQNIGPVFVDSFGPGVVTVAAAAGATLGNVPASLTQGVGMTLSSAGPGSWFMLGQNGSFASWNQNIHTLSYTMTQTDGIVNMNCSSPCTLTLPDNPTAWGPFVVANGGGAGAVTIAASGGATLGNVPSSLSLSQTLIIGSFAGGSWLMYAQTPGVWTQSTPAMTCSVGTPTTLTAVMRYQTVGKTASVNIVITDTTNGTCAGSLNFTLPYVPKTNTFISCGNGTVAGGSLSGAGNAAAFVVKYDGSTLAANGAVVTCNATYETQ